MAYLCRHPAVHGADNGEQRLSIDNDTVNRFVRQMAKHARKDCLLTRLTDPLDDQFWPEPIRAFARSYVGKQGNRIPEKHRFAKEWQPFMSRISLRAGVSFNNDKWFSFRILQFLHAFYRLKTCRKPSFSLALMCGGRNHSGTCFSAISSASSIRVTCDLAVQVPETL